MKNKLLNRFVPEMTGFQWAEVLTIILVNVIFAVTNQKDPWWYILIDSLAAICGVFCVVLCAAGKRSQYYWGFVNIVGYIVIAQINHYYGEVMLNALYYLPTQFIGLYTWKKNYNDQNERVITKKMSWRQFLPLACGCAIAVLAYKLLLDAQHQHHILHPGQRTYDPALSRTMDPLDLRRSRHRHHVAHRTGFPNDHHVDNLSLQRHLRTRHLVEKN